MNLALTFYALGRVLFHLSEDQQRQQPGYKCREGLYASRAAARVIIKRRLVAVESEIQLLWIDMKGAA